METFLWYLTSVLELLWTLLMVIGCVFKGIVAFFYVPYKNISDEIVVLTGAAGDIGSSLAKKMAKQGLCTALGKNFISSEKKLKS